MNLDKLLIVFRGASGSGKSTFAKYIASLSIENNQSTTVCSADNYFLIGGRYCFDAKQLGAAHKYCFDTFLKALENQDNLIILDNTNTRESEINPYIDKAREFGYTIFSVVIENRNETKNVHNVPEETLNKQAERLKNSLKLI